MKRGQRVDITALDVTDIRLSDADDDSGHFTLIERAEGQWAMAFDGRRNVTRPRRTVQVASEFLASAQADIEAGRSHSAADALFSGVELLAEAELTLLPLERQRGDGRAKHRWVQMAINRRRKANNTRPENAELLNRLAQVRVDARYLLRHIAIDELTQLLTRARDMEKYIQGQLPRRAHVDPKLLAAKPTPPVIASPPKR